MFLIGVSLGELTRDNSFEALNSDHLRKIGAILALDVLVNNVDRLPLIWDHQGNPGNLMFDEHFNPVSIGITLLIVFI